MGTKLPIYASTSQEMTLLQTKWKQAIEPVLSLPINSGLLLQGVQLVNGANSVNHLLGRKLVGWFITRLRQSATVYDTQDSNQRPQLTLDLVASANCTVDIYVF